MKMLRVAKCSLVCFGLIAGNNSNADLLFNTDVRNTTGNVANDYHIKMKAAVPINIDNTYESSVAGGPVFGHASPGGVTGGGTTDVTINWAGATVNSGQETHIGAGTGLGGGTPNRLVITESWWTFGGLPVAPAVGGSVPKLANVAFDGTAGTGNWVVARVKIYDDAVGTTLLSTTWYEGRGSSAYLTSSSDATYAKVAYTTPSASMVPLASLNSTLPGFGADSAITLLPVSTSVPLPLPALAVLGSLLAVGSGIVAARRKRKQGQ